MPQILCGIGDACQKSIENALERFINRGIELKVQEYLFSIFLADPENAYTKMNEGYCGVDGNLCRRVLFSQILSAKNRY